jgi:uncharacterized protein
MDDAAVVDHTRSWIRTFVIGLGLCPFAGRVFDAGLIRYVVSPARDEAGLLADVDRELRLLHATPMAEIETTLVICPHILVDFRDFNDFVGVVEDRLADLHLDGIIQVASFHPRYQFAGTDAASVENYTNRSPYPMLHLLREASVSAVADDPDALLAIPEHNIATLRALGKAEVLKKLDAAGRAPG